MRYGIKIHWSEDADDWTWLTNMSEYQHRGNLKPVEYTTALEAKEAAINMGYKNFEIGVVPDES